MELLGIVAPLIAPILIFVLLFLFLNPFFKRKGYRVGTIILWCVLAYFVFMVVMGVVSFFQ